MLALQAQAAMVRVRLLTCARPLGPQGVVMDILRALSSPNMDIRKKALDIVMELITSSNIDEVW